jgi:hypothetical protein
MIPIPMVRQDLLPFQPLNRPSSKMDLFFWLGFINQTPVAGEKADAFRGNIRIAPSRGTR